MTVKIFRATLFFRASASCSKIYHWNAKFIWKIFGKINSVAWYIARQNFFWLSE